jgi:hypothetical protein
MAPASDRHGAIHAQAARLLANHLDDHPRCRVLVQPGVAIGDYNLRMKRLRPDRLVRVRVGYRDNRIACTSYIHGLPPVSSINYTINRYQLGSACICRRITPLSTRADRCVPYTGAVERLIPWLARSGTER